MLHLLFSYKTKRTFGQPNNFMEQGDVSFQEVILLFNRIYCHVTNKKWKLDLAYQNMLVLCLYKIKIREIIDMTLTFPQFWLNIQFYLIKLLLITYYFPIFHIVINKTRCFVKEETIFNIAYWLITKIHYKNVIFSTDLYQISNEVNKPLLIPFFLSVNLFIIKININIF